MCVCVRVVKYLNKLQFKDAKRTNEICTHNMTYICKAAGAKWQTKGRCLRSVREGEGSTFGGSKNAEA